MDSGEAGFFDWVGYSRCHLCEAALRVLAALGPESQFPSDTVDIEGLIDRVSKGRPGEVMDFGVEPAGVLPRYTGRNLVWLSPADDGCLRLRHEGGDLNSEAVVLRPDGRLGPFESIAGFGVPESELTEQALADGDEVLRLAQEREVQERSIDREIEEDQRRFRTEHLLGVCAAPAPKEGGPAVRFVVVYDTGVIVHYLVPKPPEEELETDDPWAEPLEEAMLPQVELSDGMGTAYKVVDIHMEESDSSLLRASQSFGPAVPAEVERLSIEFDGVRTEIALSGL